MYKIMSTEFELFPGKSLGGLFKDIYDNQQTKKLRISELIAEMKKSVRHAGDMAVIGPIIRDMVDSSIKNDDSGVPQIGVSTTPMLVYSKRLNPNYRGNIKPLDYQIYVPSGNATIYYRLLFNPTIVTPVWADITNSIAQKLSSYASYSGGAVLDSGYVAVGSTSTDKQYLSDIELGRDLLGNGDILAIECRTVSSNSNVHISNRWRDDK
jgi:hypothetical protein